MKKLIGILFLIVLTSCIKECYPLKGKISNHQVQEAKQGIAYYSRVNGKMQKNTHMIQQFKK